MNKRYMLILFAVLMGQVGFGQLGSWPGSSNQQLVRDAVEDGFFVVRQYYQLQDTTADRRAYFGRQGNPYFGCVYTLAVKGGPGYYTDGKLIEPWMYDAAYDDFRGSVKFVPVLFKAECRNIKDKIYTPFIFHPDSCEVLPEGNVYAVSDSSVGQGFRPDTVAEMKEGWMVLVTTETSLADCDSAEIMLEVYREKLVVPAGKVFCEIKTPSTTHQVLGGVFMQPEIPAPGQVVFSLVGLVGKKEGKWGITIPEKRIAARSLNVAARLTPVSVAERETVASAGTDKQKKRRKRR